MTLNSPINMQHRNSAVQTIQQISWFSKLMIELFAL